MPAHIHRPTPQTLRRLARVLQTGGLVALPTETVYGLAGHALDERACREIFRAKGRPVSDPLIVHVLDLAHAEELAHFNDAARALARRHWPGPLTLVLPRKACVPDIVTAGGDTVAIRAPAHPLARKLLELARVPLAAPSANPFSYISPTSATHVAQGLGKRIRHILDGGDCAVGVESTVLDLTRPSHPVVLRPGAIDATTLARTLQRPVVVRKRSTKDAGTLRAPGLLARHYSPQTALKIVKVAGRATAQHAVIRLRRPAGPAPAHTYWLSERGALADIARHLYRVLRQVDAAGYREIAIEAVPRSAGGLATAIDDRIRRAAAR